MSLSLSYAISSCNIFTKISNQRSATEISLCSLSSNIRSCGRNIVLWFPMFRRTNTIVLPKLLFASVLYFDRDLGGIDCGGGGDKRSLQVAWHSELIGSCKLAGGRRRLLLVLHFRARASKHFLVHVDRVELKMCGNC